MAINTQNNPLKGKNCVLSFEVKDNAVAKDAQVTFSYIPDREIVKQNDFCTFVQSIQSKECVETFANQVIEQFYNEALPFYTKLELKVKHPNTGEVQYLKVVKKQPNYTIPEEIRDLI